MPFALITHQVARKLAHKSVTKAALLVYCYIKSYHFREDFQPRLSYAMITQTLGFHRQAIATSLEILQRLRLITRDLHDGMNRFTIHPVEGEPQDYLERNGKQIQLYTQIQREELIEWKKDDKLSKNLVKILVLARSNHNNIFFHKFKEIYNQSDSINRRIEPSSKKQKNNSLRTVRRYIICNSVEILTKYTENLIIHCTRNNRKYTLQEYCEYINRLDFGAPEGDSPLAPVDQTIAPVDQTTLLPGIKLKRNKEKEITREITKEITSEIIPAGPTGTVNNIANSTSIDAINIISRILDSVDRFAHSSNWNITSAIRCASRLCVDNRLSDKDLINLITNNQDKIKNWASRLNFRVTPFYLTKKNENDHLKRTHFQIIIASPKIITEKISDIEEDIDNTDLLGL